MRIRFLKQWLGHKPGSVFTPPFAGPARELVRRRIAEVVADPVVTPGVADAGDAPQTPAPAGPPATPPRPVSGPRSRRR